MVICYRTKFRVGFLFFSFFFLYDRLINSVRETAGQKVSLNTWKFSLRVSQTAA